MAYTENWQALKTDFITGDIGTLRAFAVAKGIGYSTLTKRTTGWLAEREEYHEKMGRSARAAFLKEKEASAESQAEEFTTIVDHMLSQYRDLWSEYQHIAKGLKKATPNRKSRHSVLQTMRSLERSLTEMSKQLETLSGRASQRLELGKVKKDKLDEFYNKQKGILDKMRVISHAG